MREKGNANVIFVALSSLRKSADHSLRPIFPARTPRRRCIRRLLLSGDFLRLPRLGATLGSCVGIVRCPTRIGSFRDVFSPFLSEFHRLSCPAPEIGVAEGLPYGGMAHGLTSMFAQADSSRDVGDKIAKVEFGVRVHQGRERAPLE